MRYGKSIIDIYMFGIYICKFVLSLDGGSVGFGIREGFLSLFFGVLICVIVLYFCVIVLKLFLMLLMRVCIVLMK